MQAGRLVPSLLVLSVLTAVACAWSETGHMIVAQIAREHLDAKVLAKVDALLLIGGDEKTREMLGASCWADDVKRDRRETAPWHYIDQHFRQDGKPVTNRPDAGNVQWAIGRFKAQLKDTSRSDAERSEALRWLLHLVGDIHQPLHTVSRDSDAEPNGDKGGNSFKVLPPAIMADMARPISNLHALWDLGCGMYRGTRRPMTAGGREKIEAYARDFQRQFPETALPEASSLDTSRWLAEGLDLSKRFVYSLAPNTAPSTTYIEKGQQVCAKRIALAGYRLAHLLNLLLK